VSADLYDADQIGGVPADAIGASLGCGNPTALAELKAGEIVLDLGSGGGIDVLLSARRVGPTGKAYGLDMTDDMLALAETQPREERPHQRRVPARRHRAHPAARRSVDVIISNCVINLSGDKDRVLAEAFRVLKPGGRFAVSDVVVRGTLPVAVRQSMELWVGCVAGALSESDYRAKLGAAGFTGIDSRSPRVHLRRREGVPHGRGPRSGAAGPEVDGRVVSAFIRASRPERGADEAGACCGPTCCS
jgi:SAM-dependent methyltransferase